MYKKTEEISQVKRFITSKNHLVSWTRDKSVGVLTYYSRERFEKKYSEKIENGWNFLQKDSERLYVIITPPVPATWDEYFLNSQGDIQCKKKVFENFAPKIHGKNFVVGTVKNAEMYITDIQRRDSKGNFVWTIKEESVLFFRSGDNLLYYNIDDDKNPQLTNVDINTGEIIWRKQAKNYSGAPEGKTSNLFGIIKFLGGIDDSLYITLVDGSITEIDINTGEKTNVWISNSPNQVNLDYLKNVFLEDKKKIVGVVDAYFYQIDLASKKLEIVNLRADYAPKNIQTTSRGIIAFADNHVIFPSEVLLEHSGFKYEYVNKIVALNIDTLKVDWSHHFKELNNTNAFTDVQTDENHIYVCDSQQKLHVFKKQHEKS